MEYAILGGEVWTDERGETVVILPDHLHGREPEYAYQLVADDLAEAKAVLADGQLTITSAAPHLKIAWRLVYRTAARPRAKKEAG